jgi:signal peptidase II
MLTCSTFPYGGLQYFTIGWGLIFPSIILPKCWLAWGFFGAYRELLLVLRIAMIVLLGAYLAFYNKITGRKLPLVLILTGACANVVDYFLYGHVVDMFHFKFWGRSFAIFNIADATICCGVIWLLLYPWLVRKRTHDALRR